MQTLTRRRLIPAGATAALWPAPGALHAAPFDRKAPDATARIHRPFAVLPRAPGVNRL
ncbi:hypothetical protein [Pseudooceanicola sp. 200-1SW]|uniref:hypothetical protein n=1 Tax=Pseudooceanicola sp. 200-1SW TaxID=3425949 RepID=UPI003D7FF802